MSRPSFFRVSSTAIPIAVFLALALTGCARDEVRTYAVKKSPADAASTSSTPESAASAASMPDPKSNAAMANTAVNTASGPGLAWDVPARWSPGPERPMRKATLLIPSADGGPGAELAVTAFPGDVGGNLANVNRWRQQLALPPITEAELGRSLVHMDVGALHIDFVELAGPATPPATAQRVIGAIVPYSGATWFFKVTGPDALVAAEKAAFLDFLRTLRPSS
jgi:hypothetical protein